ncbi:hypothetical protein MNV49_006720 [Pseudohyphozyma bogoriensis]|nr:hypothetical protein MNV49_006720 [Pseudohyphozyma bogoriensis]
MQLSLAIFSIFTLVFASLAAPIPSSVRNVKRVDTLDPGDVITCGSGATLVTHDCNVAFLSMGGGIAGSIQFLRVDASTTSGTSGTCTFTATAINGGTTINASKGRLEHGQEPMIAQCGPVVGSTVTIIGGSKGGDLLLEIQQA